MIVSISMEQNEYVARLERMVARLTVERDATNEELARLMREQQASEPVPENPPFDAVEYPDDAISGRDQIVGRDKRPHLHDVNATA